MRGTQHIRFSTTFVLEVSVPRISRLYHSLVQQSLATTLAEIPTSKNKGALTKFSNLYGTVRESNMKPNLLA